MCPLTLGTGFTPVSCSGGTDGTAFVNVSGGSGNYSFIWSIGGQTGITATTMSATTYTVTVTDNTGGCTATATVTLTQPAPLTVTTTKTDAGCTGVSNGTATANPSGGNGTYTYSWTNGQTGKTATGLAPGAYIVRATDIKGCTRTALVNIGTLAPNTISFTNTDILCNGGTTGSAVATLSGGTGPFTYNWSSGSTAPAANNLSQGSYTVTISDAIGCAVTNSVTITQPTAITVTATPVNLTCNNSGNGRATASASGGVAGYNYSWTGAQAGITATSLAAGSYTVTVTDANNCTATTNVSVTQPAPVITSSTSINVSCFGYNDGKAWVTPNGSKAPYVYVWNPSLGINDTIFGLTAGGYTVTVTDFSGCTQSTVITISEPTQLSGTVTGTNSSCNGATDGTATIVPSSGTPPYTYFWNTTPPQNTATANNLGPGTFTIRLTDANGCEFYANVTISDAAPLFINNPSITQETCLRGNGAATITILGGTAPYTYSWNPTAQTINTASGLSAGTYSVTVTDSKGCSTTKTAVVTNQFSPPTAFANTINNVSCFGANNGRAAVTASAGTPPYVYSWSPSGGAGATATNLSPGTYTIRVTDANGCTATSSTVITEPASMTITTASTNATCGLTNGTASATPSGGTLPYTINWSNSATGITASNLAAGTYTVTVRDAGGCSRTNSVTISLANPLNIILSSTNIACNGTSNGTATVSASGGSGSFNYAWAPAGGTGSTATGLAPGTYTVTVSDAGNAACSGTSTAVITQPAVLTAPITIVDISCSGNNNGQASVSPTGGAGTYTYIWSNGSTTSAITGLAAGGYTVTVTDNNGCSKTANGTVIQNTLVTASITGTDVKCSGQNSGQAVVTAGGGSGSYSYSWTPTGGTSSTATALAANTYTVTVTDGNGCTKTATITITQPTVFTISTNKTDASCGSNNGTANVNSSGGVTPYTYAWSNGITSATAANLAPDTYTVVVNDANSCARTATVTISISNSLAASAVKTDINCNGTANGTSTISPTGGSGTYNYNWSPGGYTTSSVTGLTPAAYTITVTDEGNAACSTTVTVSITEPAVLNSNISGVNITCNGSNNGQASANPTGGTTPYTYNWSTGSTSGTITGLGPNTYTITVTDANSCSSTATVAITQGAALSVTVNTHIDVACFGTATGTASINASGGTGTLTYLWSPSGGTGATATGLVANTYTLSINDANNCASTTAITITEAPDLLLTQTTTTATCGISDGTATISPTGGTTPYTYSWSSGGTNALEIGLAPGNYTVTVTDANNCSKTRTVTIVVGNPISLITTQSNITCNGLSNGTASVSATGGTGSYIYSWVPGGSTSATIGGVIAGSYTISVIDAINNACSASTIITITQPNPLTVPVTRTNIICFGQTNGTTTATPNGGTPSYTYNWTPVAGTGSGLNNLSVGTYTVTVSDANGCTATSSATVTEPPVLTLQLDSVNVSCIGAYDGGIGSTTGGGVPVYTYTWAPNGGATDSIGGLGPGTYTLTVTDANGCTITRSITITEPPPFYISTSDKDPTCYNLNGEAYVSVTGGTGPFSFLWTPTGSINDTITGLGPGTYQVRVIDLSTGCDTIGTVILAYPVVTVNLNSLDVTCKNFNDAKAWAIASGATAPYTYSWSYAGSVNDTITGLSPGTYSVTVSDNGSCITTGSVSVTEPVILSLTKTSSDVTCFAGNNGTAGITAAGGTTPYTYSWSSGQTSASITGRTAGTYTVTLTDNNNCTLTETINITQPPQLVAAADSVNITCFGNNDGKVLVNASGGTGSYSFVWSMVGSPTGNTVTGLSAGPYTVTITDGSGCTTTSVTIVDEPAALSLTMSKAEPNCGQTNGKASVNVSGGNSGYTYQWSPVAGSNDTIINISKGSYTVTVTDTKGCSSTSSIQLTEPDAISASLNSTNVTCNGANDGTANVTASGGSGNYDYSWSPGGATTATIINLSTGKYKVTIKDIANSACALVDSVVISEPATLNSPVNSTNVTCFGKGDGTATATVTGGAGVYTYTWSDASTTATISNLIPNIYAVTVTDNNGCNTTGSVTITQPTILSAAASGVNITCNGYNNGKAFVTATGGTAPYNYTWNPGTILGDTLNNLAPGSFTVTVSDINSCTATASVTITEPSGMTLMMNRTNTACGSNIGSASVTANGGTTPYTYLWSNGNTSTNINSLYKGLYIVTVTDNTGCTKSDSARVTEPNGIAISFATTNITCNGSNDGKITVTATGGSGSYIYSWVPSGNTATTLSGLSAGNYVIQVTDATNLICNSIGAVTITQPPLLSGTMSQTPVTCFGDSTGTASVTASGGNAPYTYSWAVTGSTTATITGLKQGIYTVNITDNKGCIAARTIAVTQPTPVTINTSIKQATCGNSDGEAYVQAGGGTVPYVYSWTPVFTANDTLTGLLPGKYFVYASDANSCTKQDSVTITLTNGINTNLTAVSATCFGDKDGSASVTANGGSGTFTFQWGPINNSNQNIFNLAPGMYTVTVTDININGCIKIDSILVPEPPIVDVTLSVTKSACSGNNNYVATANPSGGTPGYNFTWSFGGTNQIETGLIPGTYIVAVSDSKGCDTAKIFTINSSSTPFILPPLRVNPKCNLPNGSISVTIFGGMPPYTYSWSPSISTGPTATNLSSGIYTLTVTDAYNCTDARTISLINTALPPNVIANAVPAVCFGTSTGGANATANAGSVPYTYSWSPTGGGGTATTPIPAGIYTIVVTDAQACTATATATVTEPPDIAITITKSNVSCFGGSDGVVAALVGGGTPGYSYSWSSGGTALVENNLSAGQYNFTVTDSQSCTKTNTVAITEPPVLTATGSVVNNVFCNGGSNGNIKASVTGGTPFYTYSWTPAGGADSISGLLPQGSYTVNITDSKGCTTTTSAVITQPVPYSAFTVKKNVSCFGGNDGQAKVVVSGSSAPYLYSWAPMSNFTDSVSNLKAGTYTIYVIDSLGCPFTYIDSVSQPPKIVITTTIANSSCTGSNNGTATATAAGGTPPYNFLWPFTGSTATSITNLAPGSYGVYVTDANNCIDSSFALITEPTPLSLSISGTDLICYNDSTGTASVVANGATPSYTYSWMPGSYTGSAIGGIHAGIYTVTVNDNNGCIKVDSVIITQPVPITGNATKVDVLCYGQKTGSATLNASGGTPGYSYSWNTGNVTPTITPIFSGSYKYTITDSKGCKLADSVIISQPGPVLLTVAGSPVKCFNSCEGQAVVTPANGVLPYSFAWSNGGNTASISNLCAGGYTIIVTDANGCPASTNITITQPTPLILTPGSSTAHCNINDGTATVSASGASPPYNYLWNPTGSTSTTVSGLAAGDYTVIVTDINGCVDSTLVNVGNSNGPDVLIGSFTNTNCLGICSGTASSQVSGGTGPYTYSWNTVPPQLTVNAQNMCAGDYYVAVTDIYGCIDTANVSIKAPTINLIVSASDTDVCIGQTVNLNVTASGGTPAYQFTWDNGAFIGQNYSVNPTITTTYTVVVKDATGCPSLPVTVKVNVKQPLVIAANAPPPAACPGTSFIVSVTGSGGNGNYSYTWQPGNFVGNSITVTPGVTTTYTITGNDDCGTPSDTAMVTVNVYPDPIVNFIASDTAGCLNVCTDFTDQSTVAAGSTIVSWLWDFGDGTTSTQQNPTHCYNMIGLYNVSLTVTTDKGCTQILNKPNYISILGLPVAGFTMDHNSVSVLSPLVNFTDQSTGTLSWEWDFGDGSTVDSLNYVQNPRHTYKDTGTFCIWQIVTNYDACKDSIKHCLRVYPEYSFYIPNAFSPNGDGINDGFNGKGTYIREYRMMVFDRWGNLIFVTESLNLDWDGRANHGQEVAQQDVYVWKVDLIDVFYREHKYVGHVTLVK
ncbi:MAG: gliding motility-associated C-terminal domain-containing protein [Bacteroidetes bacterium]|nr:gliding motility-associated C-terminal domain-containing protein [Bacteroidota bacterium]